MDSMKMSAKVRRRPGEAHINWAKEVLGHLRRAWRIIFLQGGAQP